MSTVLRSLMIKVGVDLGDTAKQLNGLARTMESSGKKLSTAGNTLTKSITAPVLALVGSLSAAAMTSSAAAMQIQKVAAVSSLSTDRVQELSYVSRQLGMNLDDITGVQVRLIRSMAAAKAGSEGQVLAFQRLGVATLHSDGSLRNANDVFLDVVDALGRIGNETERDAASLAIFGKSSLSLNPLIEAGAEKLRAWTDAAHATGAVMGAESVAALAKFKGAMDGVNQSMQVQTAKISMALMPVLERIPDLITNYVVPAFDKLSVIITGVIDWFDRLTPYQQKTVLWGAAFTLALGPALSFFGGISSGIASILKLLPLFTSGITTALSTVGIAFDGLTLGIWGAVAALTAFLVLKNNADVASLQAGLDEAAAAGAPTPKPVPGAEPPGTRKGTYPGQFGPYKPGMNPNLTDLGGGLVVPGLPEAFRKQDPEVAKALEKTKAAVDAAKNSSDDLMASLKKTEEQAAKTAALEKFRSSVQNLVQTIRSATQQFASFIGAFDIAEKHDISAGRLANRMKGQLRAVRDWAAAMQQIKGKVSAALYSELLNLGPGAVDEIVALANSPEALAEYASAWQQKLDIAGKMGVEAARAQQQVDQLIEKQINNITVTGADPEKVAEIVVRKLRLAGVR
jgi:hypothetical protein